jgi:tetratricopeptide (TPR) repeat protein
MFRMTKLTAAITALLLALVVSAAVFAQPAPRPTYPAEVRISVLTSWPYTSGSGGYTMRTSYTATRIFVFASSEENAERVARDLTRGRDPQFIRWVPQAEYEQMDLSMTNNGVSYFIRARMFFNKGNYARARADVDKILYINNIANSNEEVLALSEEIRKKGYPSTARQQMEAEQRRAAEEWRAAEERELVPESVIREQRAAAQQQAQTHYKSGVEYANKDYDRAITEFTSAIQIDPNFADAYYLRGLTHSKKRDYDPAIADFNQAIRLNPNLVAAYYNRAYAYMQKSNFTQARADVNKALQLNPNYGSANTLNAELRQKGY